MEYVGLTSEQNGISNWSLSTGHTVNYKGTLIHYVRVGLFAEIHQISERQLKRYRDQIETDKMEKDHRLYFHNTDGIYYYNDRILKFRKYQSRGGNKATDIKEKATDIKEVAHSVQPFTECLLKRIKQRKWDFIGSVRYWKEHEINECVDRIKKANEEFVQKFPAATITMFFTTEKNPTKEGYHNHLVLSFDGIEPPSVNQIKKVLASAGTLRPWVDHYDATDNYIDYMVKEVHLYPDGWGLLSSSQSDLNGYISGLVKQEIYQSPRSKNWKEEAFKWK